MHCVIYKNKERDACMEDICCCGISPYTNTQEDRFLTVPFNDCHIPPNHITVILMLVIAHNACCFGTPVQL